MPGILTDYFFALTVAKQAGLPVEDAYLWGAQETKTLLLSRPRTKNRELLQRSKLLQQKLIQQSPSAVNNAIYDAAKTLCTPAATQAARGFLCSSLLSSCSSSFFEAKLQQLQALQPAQPLEILRNELNAMLDTVLLRRETGRLPSEFPMQRAIPAQPDLLPQLAHLYGAACGALFADPSHNIYTCTQEVTLLLSGARRGYSACNDRTGLKKSFFARLERGGPHTRSSLLCPLTEDPELDCSNFSGQPLGEPACSETYFELFDNAVI